MIVTATEFKTNLGKYLEMAMKQDIFITKNGKNIARLTSPTVNKLAVLDSLVGPYRQQAGRPGQPCGDRLRGLRHG